MTWDIPGHLALQSTPYISCMTFALRGKGERPGWGPRFWEWHLMNSLILKPPPVPTSRFRYVVIFMDFGGSPRAGADHQNLHGLRSKSPTSDTIARVTPSCLSAVPTISRSPFTFGPLRGKAAVGIRWVPMFENDVPINARRSFSGHVWLSQGSRMDSVEAASRRSTDKMKLNLVARAAAEKHV